MDAVCRRYYLCIQIADGDGPTNYRYWRQQYSLTAKRNRYSGNVPLIKYFRLAPGLHWTPQKAKELTQCMNAGIVSGGEVTSWSRCGKDIIAESRIRLRRADIYHCSEIVQRRMSGKISEMRLLPKWKCSFSLGGCIYCNYFTFTTLFDHSGIICIRLAREVTSVYNRVASTCCFNEENHRSVSSRI